MKSQNAPQESLRHLTAQRQYLVNVQNACADDLKTLKAAGRATATLEELDRRAGELSEGFVLRYGVVGDSNAGKSLLIGALVGVGQALPVNPVPETGNITILHVSNDDTPDVTRVGRHHLNFFTPEQAHACFGYLVREAAKELEVSPALARELRDLSANGALPAEGVLDWVRRVWPKLPIGLDVRNRLIELARFCAAWLRCGLVVAGQQVEMPRPIAEAAMVLPKDATAEKTDDTANPIMSAILAAAARPPYPAWPTSPDAEFAQTCYPLIRDIRVGVVVPRALWDLQAFHVQAVELLDFPGLRATKTAARDRYLADLERDVDRVHTWLVVVNAADLTGSMATQLIRELDASRILAVANRFDELSLAKEGYLRKLDEMVAPAAQNLTQPKVVEQILPFEPLTGLLPQLTPPERTAVVSALLGLAELDRHTAYHHRILTDDQRKDWVHVIAAGESARGALGKLPEKIAPQNRAATLSRG